MIDRKSLKEFYSNLTQHVIQQNYGDEVDVLFLKFIEGLSDAFVDGIAKHPQFQNLKIENPELFDVTVALESYMYAFCIDHPAFREDDYGLKAARLFRAFVFEILEDVNIPAAKRLAVADNQLKSLRAYNFIDLIERTSDFETVSNYIENKRSHFLAELHPSSRLTLPESARLNVYDLFYWTYGLKILSALEEKLKGAGRLEISSTLIPLFSTGIITDELMVSWKGRQGALIYLIYRVADKQRTIKGLNIHEFTSNRFMVGQDRITSKQLSSTFSNLVSRHFKAGFTPDYIEEINELLHSVGFES